MSETHLVSALRAKRAEISGYIHDLERKIKRQRASLVHLDATIRLFAPGLNPDNIPPKRTYRRTRYFAKGELSRAVLDTLRNADGEPIAATAIAAGVITAKGFAFDDDALAASVTERVLTILRRLTKRGTVIKSGASQNAQWTLAASR